jgi:hypothetical protein
MERRLEEYEMDIGTYGKDEIRKWEKTKEESGKSMGRE